MPITMETIVTMTARSGLVCPALSTATGDAPSSSVVVKSSIVGMASVSNALPPLDASPSPLPTSDCIRTDTLVGIKLKCVILIEIEPGTKLLVGTIIAADVLKRRWITLRIWISGWSVEYHSRIFAWYVILFPPQNGKMFAKLLTPKPQSQHASLMLPAMLSVRASVNCTVCNKNG